MLKTLIEASSEATYTEAPALSKMAQFAEVKPLSKLFSSFTIRMSQIFVIPSQSAETTLSPYEKNQIPVSTNSFVSNEIIATYPDVEFARVYSVIVSVEGLYALTRTNVPHRYCLVAAT